MKLLNEIEPFSIQQYLLIVTANGVFQNQNSFCTCENSESATRYFIYFQCSCHASYNVRIYHNGLRRGNVWRLRGRKLIGMANELFKFCQHLSGRCWRWSFVCTVYYKYRKIIESALIHLHTSAQNI